jgi:hypothetical protein
MHMASSITSCVCMFLLDSRSSAGQSIRKACFYVLCARTQMTLSVAQANNGLNLVREKRCYPGIQCVCRDLEHACDIVTAIYAAKHARSLCVYFCLVCAIIWSKSNSIMCVQYYHQGICSRSVLFTSCANFER